MFYRQLSVIIYLWGKKDDIFNKEGEKRWNVSYDEVSDVIFTHHLNWSGGSVQFGVLC